MGAKQSATGSASALSQSPTLENIREAYGQDEEHKAQELIRIACQEICEGRADT
ncbi:leucine-rich repeat serine/threonine-protein kinase 1 isoform X1, partial [Tachysurus ichikawai]